MPFNFFKFSFLFIAAASSSLIAQDLKSDEETAPPTKKVQISWPEADFGDPVIRGRAFKPGESFTYRTQWGIFRKAGFMTLSVEAPADETSETMLIKSSSDSKGFIKTIYPVSYDTTSILDSNTWRVLSNETKGETRGDSTHSKSTFDYEKMLMTHDDPSNPHRNGSKEIPYPVVLDYSASLLQVRGWDLKEGEKYPLMVGTKGKFYFTEMQVFATETIKTKFGKIEAFRIQPVNPVPQGKIFRDGGGMTLWVSTDERRILLRIDIATKYGTASMKLEEFTLSDESKQAKIVAPQSQPSS